MAQVEKIGNNVELKSPAEKFYKHLKDEIHRTPTAASDKVQSVSVHEGDEETAGSTKLIWKYTIDGKQEQMKEKVEIDEATKTVNFVGIEGHILELYKTYKVIVKVESGLAKITLEYEKRNAEIPAPYNYLQLVTEIVKDIDAHVVVKG
ncbi:hypothetical protein L6164_001568 [Bauhinia variegata]|uniref:Uncharacterized protein n=1 Tax=Bauhinia variegata TaxID=167791 RepID=A0ACB9QD48_BAUVA|nr:hypothetical protein L6164_001568 [Bauhinia variegata]